MVSLGGKPLGTGQSCVHSIVGCDPLVPFCHQTVDATFTLAFARGTVTAPMTLHEVLPTESLTSSEARAASPGTGAYARARGSVEGGGTSGPRSWARSAVVYAVRLKGQPVRAFRVELHLPAAGPGALAVAGERARRAVEEIASEGVRVRWIRSVYVAEEDACFFVFEAPSPDAVGEASRRAAVEYERIVEGGDSPMSAKARGR